MSLRCTWDFRLVLACFGPLTPTDLFYCAERRVKSYHEGVLSQLLSVSKTRRDCDWLVRRGKFFAGTANLIGKVSENIGIRFVATSLFMLLLAYR